MAFIKKQNPTSWSALKGKERNRTGGRERFRAFSRKVDESSLGIARPKKGKMRGCLKFLFDEEGSGIYDDPFLLFRVQIKLPVLSLFGRRHEKKSEDGIEGFFFL